MTYKQSKVSSALSSKIMIILLSTCIVLYRHRKLGHHLGTKKSNNIVASSALTAEKVSIFNSFHDVVLYSSSKSNTIFDVVQF